MSHADSFHQVGAGQAIVIRVDTLKVLLDPTTQDELVSLYESLAGVLPPGEAQRVFEA